MSGVKPTGSAFLLLTALVACGVEPMPVVTVPQDLAPVWHPDGQRLAIQHEGVEEVSGIYLVRVSPAERQLVVAGAYSPDWSPDGTQLVVGLGGQIFRVSLGTGEATAISNPEAWNGSPSWSPDGRWIAFSSNGGDSHSPPDLWIKAVGSDLPAQRVPIGGPPRDEMFEKDWSPASDRLVLSVAGRPQRLFVTDLSGRDTAYITGGDADAGMPAWHPQGEWIAYVRSRNSYGDVWLIRSDGSEDHLVLRLAAYPSWSPDGQRLVVTRPSDSSAAVWSVNPDGSDLRQLTSP